MGKVLSIPMMRRLWYAQIISVFGDFLAIFAVIGFLTFKMHATPEQVTGLQIWALLPIAVLGLIAGVFVDRWPLKPTMIASDLLRAALVLLLLPVTQVWHFYGILACIGVVSSFFMPAQGVAIRSAVPLHGLRSANALMQQVFLGMRVIGPAAAAMIVASFGPATCYALDSVSFVLSALFIASVPFLPPGAAAPQVQSPNASVSALRRVWLDMKQGIDFILHHSGLVFILLALAAGMFVLGCFGPLIAVYVRDTVHASNRIFGFASAIIGVGMLAGINALTVLGKNLKNSTLIYAGLGGIAVGLLVLVGFAQIGTTLLGNFVIGFAVAAIIVPAQTTIQRDTPPALMGRVGSTTMSLIFTAQISGLVLSGVLAEAIGVRAVFAVCAVLLVVLMAVGRLHVEPNADREAA
jgi:MFS family permease